MAQRRTVLIAVCIFGLLLLASLACAAQARNMAIPGTPRYVCPSSTPLPTHTPLPPNPPSYPYSFSATLDYYYVDPTRSTVTVQYLAQNTGWVTIGYSGTHSDGSLWSGSYPAAYFGNWAGSFGYSSVFIPVDVNSATLTANGYSLLVTRYTSPVSSSPNPVPCCLAAPIFPTPRPTYTPYPTPTLFQIPNGTPMQEFFLEDPLYNRQPPVQVRLRMKAPIYVGGAQQMGGFEVAAAAFTLEITNVGMEEYDFLGAGYLYISEISTPTVSGTVLTQGVWSPAHSAAEFLGVVEQAYGPRALLPGQTIAITVAAWIPPYSNVSKISLVLDPYKDGDPGFATWVPGRQVRLLTWVNARNTICAGEIAYP